MTMNGDDDPRIEFKDRNSINLMSDPKEMRMKSEVQPESRLVFNIYMSLSSIKLLSIPQLDSSLLNLPPTLLLLSLFSVSFHFSNHVGHFPTLLPLSFLSIHFFHTHPPQDNPAFKVDESLEEKRKDGKRRERGKGIVKNLR